MRILITILLLIGTAYGQSNTFSIGNGKAIFVSSNQFGTQVGYFRFDSARGSFLRSGNQVRVFRSFMSHYNALQRRLDQLESIIELVGKDGEIKYPIEFKKAVQNWYEMGN